MDKNFKPRPPVGGMESKPPEYAFDAGVDEAIKRIQDLLKTLDRDVYVVINGSAVDVGKSALLSALQHKLTFLGIEAEHTPSMGVTYESKKVVFDVEQGMYENTDINYRDRLLQLNPNAPGEIVSYGDLYIGIYRPDRRFSPHEDGREKPVADIMIRNEFAKDQLNKIRR